MLKFKRPRRPSGLKAESKRLLLELGQPGSPDWPKFEESFWRKLKPHFVRIQHDKCGYCETQISGDGDVEHYRPKSVVQKLEAEGTELADSKSLRGRKRPKIAERGYWWLAYDWNNYLLSCSVCNQKYKSALFPVEINRKPRNDGEYEVCNPVKADVAREQPLLINPFEDDLDPYNHFEYRPSGLIKPRNACSRGRETIKVCGLHRVSLVGFRREKAARVWSDSEDFRISEPKSAFQCIYATNIYYDGHESHTYAGMVRVIFKEVTGLEWAELEALIVKEGWMKLVDKKFELARLAD